MNSISYFLVALLCVAVAADPGAEFQKKLNDKVDEFLARYSKRVNKESPYNISRADSFYRSDSLLYGSQVVNKTKIKGLGEVKRDGNVTGTKSGEFIWRLKGNLNLTAPLIEGSLFMVKSSTNFPEIRYVSSPTSDLFFTFSVVVNLQWKRVLIESINYRYTFPDFPITLDCPLVLNKECNSVTSNVYSINKNAAREILLLIERLLTLTPMSPP